MTTSAQVWKKSVSIDSWHNRPCGKAVKGQTAEGQRLCGGHLAAYRRQVANDNARRQAEAGSSANGKWAEQALVKLAELNIRGQVHYHSALYSNDSGYTGKVLVDPADLFRAMGIDVTLPEIQEYRKGVKDD